MSTGIQPERILKELAKLWADLAQPNLGEATASGVLRACAMTLIVAAEDEGDAQSASETLAELMHEHPSRAIVLKPSVAGDLEARVFAQCWMPFGRRQQICCEQIEIAAAPERLGDVPGLMLGLLAPDLPVVLWCRGERWFAEPHFGQLLPLIGKLIVDSERFSEPTTAFELIHDFIEDGRRVADLAWSRLTAWRDVIAQRFDTPAELVEAAQIHEVEVVSGGSDRASPGAIYLAAWLRRCLPGARVVLRGRRDAPAGIRSVRLGTTLLEVNDGGAQVRTSNGTYNVVLPEATAYTAMREELTITRPDALFVEVLALAREFVGEG